MIKHSPLLLLIWAALFLQACEPAKNMQNADSLFQQLNYSQAAEYYEAVYDKTSKSETKAKAAYKAAECYRQMNDYRKAEIRYLRAERLGYPAKDASLKYADMLRQQEKWEKALEAYKEYKQKNPSDKKVYKTIEFIEKAIAQETADSRFVVEEANKFNSPENDYAPMWYEDEALYFTTDRFSEMVEGRDKDVYGGTGKKYSDVFVAEAKKTRRRRRRSNKDKEPEFENPKAVEGDVNTASNDGTVSFGDRGRYMYFTRCNGSDREDSNCVIMVARRRGRNWTKPEKLPFCIDTNSAIQYGQPYVSKDGKRLFFAAKGLDGSLGGRDLYVSNYVARGRTWGDPINLGPDINTEGDEYFPVLYDDTTLYFASNGRPGMGGLDLFRAYGSGTEWSEPENLGTPLNSGADDFAMTFDPNGEGGYFSSNRPGARGDDIYRFKILPLVFNLTGTVYNKSTNEPIGDATVLLRTMDDSSTVDTLSNVSGEYRFELDKELDYQVSATKPKFFESEKAFVSTKDLKTSKDFERDLYLQPFADTITLSGIYYDLDKASLRDESMPVLDSLVNVLNEYPYLTIEIGSHTDCRAPRKYNQKLSQRRAQSVVDYLDTSGIDLQRLEPVGYGETKLTNKCACENGRGPGRTDPDCDSLAHQANRRTTFFVLSTDYKLSEEEKKKIDTPVMENQYDEEGNRQEGEGNPPPEGQNNQAPQDQLKPGGEMPQNGDRRSGPSLGSGSRPR